MAVIVPLSSAPNQTFQVALPINGASVVLNLAVAFNAAAGYWVMSVADKTGNPLIAALPLITGVWPAANILAPYDYLKIGSAFIVSLNGAAGDWPDDTALGSGYVMLWDSN